jgi:uncharacterized protein YbjT (DUF2867 family)
MSRPDIPFHPPSTRTVLVVGATGTVGREVVRALRERPGVRIRVLVRSEGPLPGVEIQRGDLADPDALARALEDVESAFYVSPHEENEEPIAEAFVRACEERGVRIVFAGVHVDGGSRLSRALRRLVFATLFAHYVPKIRIAERIRTSRTRPVVLMPPNFYQNDELFLDEIFEGDFVVPMRSVNRVDARDIGDAAARALTEPDFASGAYPVVGPASLSGAECAAVYARALGRPVRYAPERFDAALSAHVGGKKQADFRATYELLRKIAVPTKAADVARTTALLGRPPRGYEAYVRELVAARARSRTCRARRSRARRGSRRSEPRVKPGQDREAGSRGAADAPVRHPAR